MIRPWALIITLGLVAGLPPPAHGQGVIQLQPLTGGIGIGGRFDESTVGRNLAGRQWFRLTLSGAVLDPGLAQFSIGLTPSFAQSRTTDFISDGGSNTRSLGINLGLHLLRSRDVSASARYIRAGHSTNWFGRTVGDNSGRTEFLTAGVKWQNLLMPLEFEYRRESWSRLVFDGTNMLDVPNTFQTFRLWGYNRKTTFTAEQRNGNQSLDLLPFSSVTRLAQITNTQGWGKGSSFQTLLSGHTRSGDRIVPTSTGRAAFNLHLQHTTGVGSDWSFNITRASAGGNSTTSRGYAGNLSWLITSWASARLSGSRYEASFGRATQTMNRIDPGATATILLPFGTLSLAGSVGYETLTRTRPDGEWIPVVQESHGVGPSGAFFLDNNGADPASVVVSAGADLYVDGLDYVLIETPPLLQVVVLPSGRITPGQTVHVDYQYLVVGAAHGSLLVATYSGDLRIRWLRIYHNRWLRDSGTRGTGPSDPLRYYDQNNTGAQITINGRSVSLMLRGDHQRRIDDGFHINSTSAAGTVSVRPMPRVNSSVGASYQFSEGSTGTSKVVRGEVGLSWLIARTLTFTGDVSAWRSNEQVVIRRTQIGTTMRLFWAPGLLRFSVFYRYRDWQTEYIDRDYTTGVPVHALAIDLSRSF